MTRFTWLVLILAGCAPTLEDDGAQKDGLGASISFQNGVNGYSGTRDVSISTQYGGNGVTTTSGELMSWKISGTSGYEERALIRFDALSLPAGATVTGASLTLTFDNWSTGFSLQGQYLAADWNNVGWQNRDTNLKWATPGGDVIAGKSFTIGSFAGNGVEVKTVALDAATVQSWLAGSDRGILLVNQNSDKVTRIYSSEDSQVSRRPKLTIQYSIGNSCKSISSTFANTAFDSQAGAFTASFDATPSAVVDGVVGLAKGNATAYSGLAAIARFNASGDIDARNGGAYSAASTIPYSAGTSYHFRMVVDVAAHKYSVYVTPSGQSEILVGKDFAFRTEQNAVASLDDWAGEVGGGSVNVCNFAITTSQPSPQPTPSPTTEPSPTTMPSPSPTMVPTPSGQHPRIFLDSAALSALVARAKAGDAAWTALRNACNGYLGGTVQYPDGNDYPNLPNIGEGYQGSDYFDPIMNIGLCYQIGLQINDANTAQWGQKGADVLEKMSNPSHSPAFSRDDGYGIRFFGVGMALGYDWLYPALSSSLKTQVYTQLNGWFSWWDSNGFEHDHPQGNYFAGYYAAKAYAGIATEGDNPSGTTLYNDWLNRLHNGGASSVGSHTGVAAYYNKYMVGGGWSEGWGYGPLAAVNMGLPSLAARTGKGLDLIANYSYPLDNAMHLIQFTWPSLTSLDDRDTLHSGADIPGAPSVRLATVTTGLLAKWSHSLAPQFHAWARAIRAKQGNDAPWSDFLFWDDKASEASYTTLPLSYLSRGLNAVAMRSDWGTTATWGSFRASAYVDYDGAGEQGFDAGSLAIVRGATPFVVNATGFLDTAFPGTQTWETQIYNDEFGGPRDLYNTFYNGSSGQISVEVDDSPAPQTKVARYEDPGSYVVLRADRLADVYPSSDNISSWSREVVYLRPNRFVVYDRTSVSTISDEHLNWHVIFTPAQNGARWDVTNPTAGFMGSMTPVLPQSAQVNSVNVFGSNKVYRLEVRAPSPAATMQWLTVLDASPSAAIAAATRVNSSANVEGTLMTSSSGNSVVLFAPSGQLGSTSGNVTFVEPAAATRVVIADLAASTNYSVSVSTSGSTHSVTVAPGSGFTSTAGGALAVDISANGVVSAVH